MIKHIDNPSFWLNPETLDSIGQARFSGYGGYDGIATAKPRITFAASYRDNFERNMQTIGGHGIDFADWYFGWLLVRERYINE